MDDLSSNASLAQGWKTFILQCEQTAGWKLPARQSRHSIDEIVAQIQPSTKSHSEIYSKAKRVFSNTLAFLDKFGSAIASGVSPVFGASNQCFNAVSIVIGAVQAYEKMFEEITQVMEDMTAFCRQIEPYLDDTGGHGEVKLHKNVRTVAFEVLKHFLATLAIAHKVSTDPKTKAKRIAGLLFLSSDGGIKAAKDGLEVLVRNFTRMEISDILRNVSQNRDEFKDLAAVVSNVDKNTSHTHGLVVAMSDSTKRAQQREIIRKTLLLSDDKQSWEDTHQAFSSMSIAGTGD